VLDTIVQDAGMPWFHTLMVLIPLLVGAQGISSRLDNHSPEAVESQQADGLHIDTEPNAQQTGVLAGKRAGLPFTKKGKATIKKDNAEKNDGKNRCESCNVETVPAKQHQQGVTPPSNETQVDHVIPRAKGGEGEPDNGQILCRDCNIKKSDKAP